MTVFVPLIFFAVPEEDKEICDGVMQCFFCIEDLRILYPDVDFIEVEVGKFNIHDN